jgi:wyosine [tRNA(Phe)-imidazoG37] synthetase (radical SAM superfamily)
MQKLFQIKVNTEALTDEAYAFVTDPTPKRNDRPFIQELHDIYPEMVDVLECMVIDGTEDREDVAEYVDTVFASGGRFSVA